MFFRNSKKDKIIIDYIKNLEKSFDDERIFKEVKGITDYHKDISLDPDLVEQNGILQTIYRYYINNRKKLEILLKNVSLTEINKVEEEIYATDTLLKELAGLIIDVENAMIREKERKLLEQYLSEEEIESLKSEYLNQKIEANYKR